MISEKIDYKYNEGELLEEITRYIDSTYNSHYSQNKFQATEFILDSGHGEGFTLGNIMKYAQRYGKKGYPEDWRKDLLKVIHYAIIALHVHDKDYATECDTMTDQEYPNEPSNEPCAGLAPGMTNSYYTTQLTNR